MLGSSSTSPTKAQASPTTMPTKPSPEPHHHPTDTASDSPWRAHSRTPKAGGSPSPAHDQHRCSRCFCARRQVLETWTPTDPPTPPQWAAAWWTDRPDQAVADAVAPDREGVPLQRTALVSNGVLVGE